MNARITVAKNAFSKEFCESVTRLEPTMEGEVWGGPDNTKEHNVDHNVRSCKVLFLHGYFTCPQVFEPILPLIDKINQENYKFDLINVETLQLTKYDHVDKGFYEPHEDTDMPDINGMQRKLSFTIQLTDPRAYEGGHLVFPSVSDYDPSNVLEQGTAIIFPSYLVHGVQPVTSGVRYSLVGWARGPQFR